MGACCDSVTGKDMKKEADESNYIEYKDHRRKSTMKMKVENIDTSLLADKLRTKKLNNQKPAKRNRNDITQLDLPRKPSRRQSNKSGLEIPEIDISLRTSTFNSSDESSDWSGADQGIDMALLKLPETAGKDNRRSSIRSSKVYPRRSSFAALKPIRRQSGGSNKSKDSRSYSSSRASSHPSNLSSRLKRGIRHRVNIAIGNLSPKSRKQIRFEPETSPKKRGHQPQHQFNHLGEANRRFSKISKISKVSRATNKSMFPKLNARNKLATNPQQAPQTFDNLQKFSSSDVPKQGHKFDPSVLHPALQRAGTVDQLPKMAGGRRTSFVRPIKNQQLLTARPFDKFQYEEIKDHVETRFAVTVGLEHIQKMEKGRKVSVVNYSMDGKDSNKAVLWFRRMEQAMISRRIPKDWSVSQFLKDVPEQHDSQIGIRNQLEKESQSYQDVQSRFLKQVSGFAPGSSVEIDSIEVIENIQLWQKFQDNITKLETAKKRVNKGMMWHAAKDSATVKKILKYGILPDFQGVTQLGDIQDLPKKTIYLGKKASLCTSESNQIILCEVSLQESCKLKVDPRNRTAFMLEFEKAMLKPNCDQVSFMTSNGEDGGLVLALAQGKDVYPRYLISYSEVELPSSQSRQTTD